MAEFDARASRDIASSISHQCNSTDFNRITSHLHQFLQEQPTAFDFVILY